MDLSSSADGRVFITGETKPAAKLPGVVKWRPGIPKDAIATTRGEALVTRTAWADGKDSRIRPDEARTGRPAKIGLMFLDTDKSADFQITPGSRGVRRTIQGAEHTPALPTRGKKPLRSTAGTVEDQRYCSVPRNDPAKQAMQPKPRQVEWAVDQAITGNLNKHISRPANWKNLGMGAYQPQTLFPLVPLEGGGRIPAQVMLGITAQESNMWQASRVVVPGVTGNPLIGNYYGIEYSSDGQQTDPWAIHWDKADCGYGVTQVTDGMRRHGREKPGETPLSTLQQEAVALDYTANIAAGVNILVGKWNQTRRDGLIIDNGKPQHLENWTFALWAYNSGYYPKAEAASNGGLWGVGFTNNPANPLWKHNRTPFLERADGTDDYSHAAHPQDWPYQEKVLGWAARPLQALESPNTMVVGYRAAWWTNAIARTNMKPPIGLFCTAANQCDPSKIGPNDSNQPGMGACTRGDLKCWWNQPVSWQECALNLCGNEILRFNDTYPEEADGTAYPPNCTTAGHPSSALIIDDVPDSTPIHRPGCTVPKPSSGTFSLDFGSDSARIDLHQLGAGYTSHFWFTHTRGEDPGPQRMLVTGTWKLNTQLNSTAKVWAHIPDHGAHTKLATYEIKTAFGTRFRTIDQRGSTNRWVDLGAYRFHGITPEVKLSNITEDGTGDQDIAYDAIAFVPGNYSLLPDITLPEADENAPDPEYHDDPRPIPDTLNQPGANRTPAKPQQKCKAVQGRKGQQICLSIASAVPSAPKRHKAGAADLCANDQGHSFDRDSSCKGQTLQLTLLERGVPKGQGVWDIFQRVELNRNATAFQQKASLWPQRIDPQLGTVRLNMQFKCSGACSTGTPSWSVPPEWPPSDVRVATGTVNHSWTNGQGSGELNLEWTLGATATGGSSTPLTWSDPVLKVRCDAMVGGNAGCVFVHFIPSYKVNTKKYPAAAALYWVLMEKLPSHPGSIKHDRPLHRLADKTKQGENRGKMCKLAVAEYRNHPDTPSSSCDEYPFAASRESGGQYLASGKECVQLYATNKNGPWKLYEDERYDMPTWTEICGRGSVPLNQNSGAGGDLGRFVSPARVLDGDPFYVETPGFENCNINSVCTVRPPG